ncbi:hypothetical protein EJ02DRAFT_427832 [Clathrospora elynae]|uniref:DDE-1 domain-containing protein n=1 Tax=Clathrospora elynae TaxID=706981 RepID=A0A6A5SF94_9PLEO|nr:hypothetical protein EJ02DRAFT_427832 [Clathrospora elynae]
MDEKGFYLGRGEGSHRVFSRDSWERGGRCQPIQDGSREWLTVIAAVCADGSALPPSILYSSTSGNIQERWTKDIEYKDNEVMVGTTQTGWSNNDMGPLDVGLFSPLSRAYGTALEDYLEKTQGLLSLKKGNFYHLFKDAWDASFTVANVQSSFSTTGIALFDAEQVLKKFCNTTPESPEYPTTIDTVNRASIRLLMSKPITPGSRKAEIVKETLLSLQAQQAILEYKNNGLWFALGLKQRDYETPINALDLQMNREAHWRAQLLSPRTIRHATDWRVQRDEEEEEEQLERLRTKDMKAEVKLIWEEQARIRRVERERLKKVREEERAVKAAKRDAQKRANNAKKMQQQHQDHNCKVSKPRTRKPQAKE